jgi:hypothetical protein
MTNRLFLIAFALVALVATGQALAAKPLTQKQYAELKMKQALTAWAKKSVPGLQIGAASCVLPKNGVIIHCTVQSTAPKHNENIVFKVKETLHDIGTVTWVVTSKTCSDSKTHKTFAC